jgi:septum formation topological specificity factor MinE
VIVLKQTNEEVHNALWQIFSGTRERFFFGQRHYQWHKDGVNSIINKICKAYQAEGIDMPYTMEDFKREVRDEILDTTPPDELAKRLSTRDKLRGLTAKDRLQGLTAKDRLQGLTAKDRLQGLTLDEIISTLPKEVKMKLRGLPLEALEKKGKK